MVPRLCRSYSRRGGHPGLPRTHARGDAHLHDLYRPSATRRGFLILGAVLTMAQAPASPGFRIRIGGSTVDAANQPAVAAAIDAANAHARWQGVPDGLNPRLLDPVRVQALLAAIAALPASARAKPGDHALLLDSPGLPVKASSPSTPASFAHLTGIEVTDTQGDAVEVRVAMPLDCELARQNAAAAK